MLEQDRINATISYFFLGPLFLLAKKDTPLADPYVQGHARQASTIIGMTLLMVIAYFFLRPYLQFNFFGIDLRTVVVGTIMTICSLFLLRGAYRAYHGITETEIALGMNNSMQNISGTYSVDNDEDKARILASMLPWLGIYISKKYDHPLMERGRIIGSFFTLLFIGSLLIGGNESFLAFIITTLYIIVFVIEGVYLFIYNRFISWSMLERIPSYRELEAHITAFTHSCIDFFRVAFGAGKAGTYKQYFSQAMTVGTPSTEISKYFMPAGLIGIPVWNLFTLPSFFISNYRAYRGLIIQGFIITLLFLFIIFFSGSLHSALLLFLLFPIVHILVYAGSDTTTRSPIIGLWVNTHNTYTKMKSELSNLKDTTESTGFTYDTRPSEPSHTEEKV